MVSKLTREGVRKIARALVDGVPQTRAVLAGGYAVSTGHCKSGKIISDPRIQSEIASIRAAMLRVEPRIHERVARRMLAGLKAKEIKFFAHEGIVRDVKHVVAYGERRQMAELICKLFGELSPDAGSGGLTLNVNQLSVLVARAREERGLEA